MSSPYCIGVDVGGTKLQAGLVRGGEALQTRLAETLPSRGSEQVLEDIVELIRETASEPLARGEVLAIGLGVPGQVDPDGTIHNAPNLGWKTFAVAPRLRQEFGVPAYVINDVNAAALYYWKHGVAQGLSDLVVLFVGTGVGGGIIANNQIVTGAQGSAGELGHMIVETNGRPYVTGSRGCLEAYCGGRAQAERFRELAEEHPEQAKRVIELAGGIERIDNQHIDQAFQEGDPFAREFYDRTSEYLAAGLVTILNSLNPQMLILGGGVLEHNPYLAERAWDITCEQALPSAVSKVRLEMVKLSSIAGVVGSATFASLKASHEPLKP
ncbi:MAG: ROK family protein [Fimbriimonadaceae bacterium]